MVSRLLADSRLDVDAIRVLTGVSDLGAVEVRPAPRWLTRLWSGRLGGMTLGRRIYLAPGIAEPDVLGRLLVHELVHVRQWAAAGPVRFLTVYVADYLRGRLRRLPHREAYRSIRYEVEARKIAGG